MSKERDRLENVVSGMKATLETLEHRVGVLEERANIIAGSEVRDQAISLQAQCRRFRSRAESLRGLCWIWWVGGHTGR